MARRDADPDTETPLSPLFQKDDAEERFLADLNDRLEGLGEVEYYDSPEDANPLVKDADVVVVDFLDPNPFLESMKQPSLLALMSTSYSWVDIKKARRVLGSKVTLAANLDPVESVMRSEPQKIREDLIAIYEKVGNPFFVNAGCEIPVGTPEANLRALCEPIEML